MSLEQEIKLQLMGGEQVDIANLACLSKVNKAKERLLNLTNIYYDTPDLKLRKQGLGLRLRKKNGQYIQTVKTAGTVKNGLHQRDEWEHVLLDEQWDLTRLKQTPIKAIIEQEALWASLTPIFSTDFIRQSCQLTLADNTQVEWAYDQGQVACGELTMPIHEIELELMQGEISSMIELAEQIKAELKCVASDQSKAQIGYQLLGKRG